LLLLLLPLLLVHEHLVMFSFFITRPNVQKALANEFLFSALEQRGL